MRILIVALAAALSSVPALSAPLPGAPAMDAATAAQVQAAQPVSPPRTRHRDASGAPIYTNRLVLARSPYLRQHAHNPVNWRRWGDDALAEAAARGVPIFLSVGYATCHWCHVMEEESFDDIEVAGVLNANFVPVKVDRETLPDIDAQYMIATQILLGRGGWPNNLWLTPDGKPIVAMGYAPRDSFLEAAAGLGQDWRNPEGRTAMIEQASSVAEYVRLVSGARAASAEIGDAVFDRAVQATLAAHDSFQGGFGQGPKFPNEPILRFLLDRYERTGDEAAFQAALTTLRAMAAGGIHDHVGGGFHRYAVDPNWRTPHFEKMLYTQALLSRNYLQAYRLTRDPAFARAARRTLDYVLRDMTAPGSGFYAAQDADSELAPGGEKEEGAFYIWTHDQLSTALGGDAALAVAALGLDQPPTVPAGAVAHLDPESAPDFATLDPVLERLRATRQNRPAPLTDTKVIAGWNGLMIRALVDGAETLEEPRYLAAAERAMQFVSTSLLAPDGSMARAWAGGPLEQGSLRDYAWIGLAQIALHDSTGNTAYLGGAQRMARQMLRRFTDAPDRPLKLSQTDGPLGPAYDVIEGATPTGNAAAIELLALLARRSTDDASAVESRNAADSLIATLSGSIAEAPEANISTLTAIAVHRKGETGMRRSLGGGVATAVAVHRAGRLTIDLVFQPGWHANAAQPLNPDLIGTHLGGNGIAQVSYPEPKIVTLGFSPEPLAVLDGNARIEAMAAIGARQADLTIQICSDAMCLPPERHSFRLPVR